MVPSAQLAVQPGFSRCSTSGDNSILLSTLQRRQHETNQIQAEISTNPHLGVLTPLHAVWKYLWGRQFRVTTNGVFL